MRGVMFSIPLINNNTGFRKHLLTLAVVLTIIVVLSSPVAGARDVNVAVTDLKPSLFTDTQGKPTGFFVDLIEDMAGQEDWHVTWVRGTLTESWKRLADGEIDLMPGVTVTQERLAVYDFSNESAFSVWLQVYARPGAGINTILDLDGKTIATVSGSSSDTGFRDYAHKFGVNATYLPQDTPIETFAAVAGGEADALVVYNTAGHEDAKTYGLVETPVMFNPSQFVFAVPKGKNQDLLKIIDRYIAKGKTSPSSTYSRSMQKWFGVQAGDIIPSWLWWGLGGIGGFACLFLAMSFLLRREVRRKTAELASQNEELQAEVASRTHAEAELVQKNEELQAAYEQLKGKDRELGENYQELMRSEKALIQARKKLNLLNTLTFQDIQNAFFILAGYIQLSKEAAGCIEEAQKHLKKGENVLQSVEGALSFAEKYQNLGISQPRWQDVVYVLVSAVSHLDFSGISRKVTMPDIEIYADPLLEDVFLALMEKIISPDAGVSTITLRCRKNDGSITIIIEADGTGIPPEEKEKLFTREHAGKGGTSLFLAREILSITDISLDETGTAGTGICFEITVPDGEVRVKVTEEEPDTRG